MSRIKIKSRRYILFLIFYCIVFCALILLIAHKEEPEAKLTLSTNVSTISNSIFPLDLNKATVEELQQISGIGNVIAQDIVLYREENGNFTNLNQLLDVNGIGKAKYKIISKYVYVLNEIPINSNVSSATTSKITTSLSKPTSMSNSKVTTTKSEIKYPIDINSASFNELKSLNGISDVISQRIIDYRKDVSKFYSIEDIMKVSGIGESTFNKIKLYIYVEAGLEPPIHVTTTTAFVMVELNSATLSEFLTISNITKEDAESIVELRNLISYFSSKEELLYALSKSSYNKIVNYVYIEKS